MKVQENQIVCGKFENVILTESELSELQEKYGKLADEQIRSFSAYKTAKNISFASDFAELIEWCKRKVKKD